MSALTRRNSSYDPDMGKRADPRYLRDVVYADPSGVVARASLYDHQHPWIDMTAEALDLLGPVEGRVVADVGCGNGRYIDAVRAAGGLVIGVDLSAGMLRGVPSPQAALVAADAQSLPFVDASLDAVLMMHMLYHVPDPGMAVAEAARALRGGGRLLVCTNGPRHLAEMNALWLPLLEEAGIRGDLEDVGLVNPRVTAGDARQLLDGHFRGVHERWLPSSVVVTDSAPVIRHAASTTAAQAAGDLRNGLIAEMTEHVDGHIRRDGEFRITTEIVFLTATKA
jgi:SAM-dependent methyltransferase